MQRCYPQSLKPSLFEVQDDLFRSIEQIFVLFVATYTLRRSNIFLCGLKYIFTKICIHIAGKKKNFEF